MTNPFKTLYNRFNTWLLLRKLQKVAEPATDRKLIRTDKFGNKFYCLKNPANIPAERALHAWVYTNDSEYGLTKDRLDWGIGRIKEAINKERPDLVTIAQVIGAFEAATTLYAEPEILLNLASVYVTMNGESFDNYADYEQKAKRQMWDKDEDTKSFFLQFAHNFSKRYSEQDKLNVPDYLKKVKQMLGQINLNLDPTTKDLPS